MPATRKVAVRFYDIEKLSGPDPKASPKPAGGMGGEGREDREDREDRESREDPAPGPVAAHADVRSEEEKAADAAADDKEQATSTFYRLIFEAPSKQTQPLCRDIFQQTGTWTVGKCEEAAAYTLWSLTFGPSVDAVYSPEGTKTPIATHITSSVTLPEWPGVKASNPDDRAEIMRVCMRTAHHEAGHRLCPEAVAAAVDRFWAALPQAVPPIRVPALNKAVSKVIHGFYEHVGRNITDVVYDKLTRHGYIQGAVFNQHVDKQGDDRTVFTKDDSTLVAAMAEGLVVLAPPRPLPLHSRKKKGLSKSKGSESKTRSRSGSKTRSSKPETEPEPEPKPVPTRGRVRNRGLEDRVVSPRPGIQSRTGTESRSRPESRIQTTAKHGVSPKTCRKGTCTRG